MIVGVGNIFRHDDGIGPEIIKRLKNQPANDCDLLDAGTDSFLLLDNLQKYQTVLIVDAVNMGMPAGTIKTFTPQEARLNIRSDSLSTHGFDLAWVIKLKEQLNIKSELTIIGIQPENIDFGEGLSDIVGGKISALLAVITDAMQIDKSIRI